MLSTCFATRVQCERTFSELESHQLRSHQALSDIITDVIFDWMLPISVFQFRSDIHLRCRNHFFTSTFQSIDYFFYLVTVTFKLDLMRVKLNHRAKHLGQRSLHLKDIAQTCRQTCNRPTPKIKSRPLESTKRCAVVIPVLADILSCVELN